MFERIRECSCIPDHSHSIRAVNDQFTEEGAAADAFSVPNRARLMQHCRGYNSGRVYGTRCGTVKGTIVDEFAGGNRAMLVLVSEFSRFINHRRLPYALHPAPCTSVYGGA